MKLTSVLVAVAALALVASSAEADVLFDNFGPGDAFDANMAYTLNLDESLTPGFAFTAATNSALTQIDIGLVRLGLAGTAKVSLVTADTGILLGSWNVAPGPLLGSANAPATHITGITGVNLVAGDSYILRAANVGNFFGGWAFNSTGAIGPVYVDGAQVPGYESAGTGAFRITVGPSAVVPEPGVWALMIVGFGLAGQTLRRRVGQPA